MKYLDKIKRGGKIGGITYNGTVQNGLAHGKGTMIFNGSRKIYGSFNNGKCVGFGFIFGVPVYNDGEQILDNHEFSYYGHVNDECLPNGLGHLSSSSLKTSYYGDFKDGKYHGYGELMVNDTATRSKFEHGKAVDSFYDVKVVEKKVGERILKYDEERNKVKEIVCNHCDTYIGEYPTGKGTINFKNGDIYKGEYPTGKGTITFKNGDIYEGEYPTGKGIMKFKNGDTYIGDYPTGKGVLTFKNGDTYIGKYPTGKGTMNFKNGDVYEGEYPTGKGTIKFKNGDKHEVKLANGKRNMSFPHEKPVNSEQVDERRVNKIKEELKKIQIDQSNALMKELTSLLESKELTNNDLNKAEELLKKIQDQVQSNRSFGMKELAGVAGVDGVAGLSYYLYNKFKKSSKRRVKSSSSKSFSRKSSRRSKESEQSSLS